MAMAVAVAVTVTPKFNTVEPTRSIVLTDPAEHGCVPSKALSRPMVIAGEEGAGTHGRP